MSPTIAYEIKEVEEIGQIRPCDYERHYRMDLAELGSDEEAFLLTTLKPEAHNKDEVEENNLAAAAILHEDEASFTTRVDIASFDERMPASVFNTFVRDALTQVLEERDDSSRTELLIKSESLEDETLHRRISQLGFMATHADQDQTLLLNPANDEQVTELAVEEAEISVLSEAPQQEQMPVAA